MATGDLKQGTSLEGGVIGQGQLADAAAKLSLTINGSPVTDVPAATYVVVKKAVFTNGDTSARTVSYGVLKSGGTPGAAGTLQAVGSGLGAAGSATHVIDATELEGVILGPGDSIAAYADSASKVNYMVSGAVSH